MSAQLGTAETISMLERSNEKYWGENNIMFYLPSKGDNSIVKHTFMLGPRLNFMTYLNQMSRSNEDSSFFTNIDDIELEINELQPVISTNNNTTNRNQMIRGSLVLYVRQVLQRLGQGRVKVDETNKTLVLEISDSASQQHSKREIIVVARNNKTNMYNYIMWQESNGVLNMFHVTVRFQNNNIDSAYGRQILINSRFPKPGNTLVTDREILRAQKEMQRDQERGFTMITHNAALNNILYNLTYIQKYQENIQHTVLNNERMLNNFVYQNSGSGFFMPPSQPALNPPFPVQPWQPRQYFDKSDAIARIKGSMGFWNQLLADISKESVTIELQQNEYRINKNLKRLYFQDGSNSLKMQKSPACLNGNFFGAFTPFATHFDKPGDVTCQVTILPRTNSFENQPFVLCSGDKDNEDKVNWGQSLNDKDWEDFRNQLMTLFNYQQNEEPFNPSSFELVGFYFSQGLLDQKLLNEDVQSNEILISNLVNAAIKKWKEITYQQLYKVFIQTLQLKDPPVMYNPKKRQSTTNSS